MLDPISAGESNRFASIARACSPRVQLFGDAAVFDATGLSRVIGSPAEIASEVTRLAESQGLTVRVAIAQTMTSAWLLAHARSGSTIATGNPAAAIATLPVGWVGAIAEGPGWCPKAREITEGTEAGTRSRATSVTSVIPAGRAGNYRQAPGPSAMRQQSPAKSNQVFLGPLALGLGPISEVLAIFERWGLRTLGDVARLPRADLLTRLGPTGARLHQAACGEDAMPLVPSPEAPQFVERLDLEWPIEGLEPLSFVLGRLCDSLSMSLERADRGAVAITTRLRLVTRVSHERTLHLPSPLREGRVLRTLILLDLESHPPADSIDRIEIDLAVTPGRILQGSLLTRTLPTPENLATLIARLGALMGELRIGSPTLVDSHDERRIDMTTFTVKSEGPRVRRSDGSTVPRSEGSIRPTLVLRRFRHPIPARVQVERGSPVRVDPSGRELPGGRVVSAAGPWRSSGRWWAIDGTDWQRDEWDVELDDGVLYRIARDRIRGAWEIAAIVD